MDSTQGRRIPYPGRMDIRATALPEVKVLMPRRLADARGFFCETWSAARMAASGLDIAFVQDNEARSARAGTLRGLHCQAPPFAQAKLVRAARGAILAVAVDARVGSPTWGRWVAEKVSEEDGAQLLVPRGFLLGYLTLTDDALVLYKVDNPYHAASEGAVAWDDPDLAIAWGIAPEAVILSDRDRRAPRLKDWSSPFVHGAAR